MATIKQINVGGTSYDIKASQLANARTITNNGDLTGSFSFDGSADVTNTAYIHYGKAGRNNAASAYKYHRILTIGEITNNYYDAAATIYITQDFDGGAFGIARATLRTNNVSSQAAPTVKIEWLVRAGFAVDALQFGLKNNAGAATADIYYVSTGTYSSITFRVIQGARGTVGRRWTLVDSQCTATGASTTPSVTTEVYTALNRIAYTSTGNASDAGRVNVANSADSAAKATYADYPTGFTARGTNATWGNQTGTTLTQWSEPDGGAIDFRKNNPSSGKISIKVDGRFYFNEGATPAAGLKSANSYWGMTGPDGEDNVWIRTTSLGIIPYQSGSSGSGHGSLGTSTWYFSGAYIDNIYTTSGAAGFKCRNISMGTATPSGGINGDVYIQYT